MHRTRRHVTRWVRDDRGFTSLEFAVTFPVLLLALMLVVQLALMFHARNLVTAAAQDGVLAAKAETGSEATARAAAEAILDEAGASMLTDHAVTVRRDDDRARVRVTGSVIALVPGLALDVHGEAEAPIERFRNEDER